MMVLKTSIILSPIWINISHTFNAYQYFSYECTASMPYSFPDVWEAISMSYIIERFVILNVNGMNFWCEYFSGYNIIITMRP